MNYLLAENVRKVYGEQILFSDFNLSINKGQKIGLIARNGTGKTTLLRILVGLESSDLGGSVRVHRSVRIGYLDQAPDIADHLTVLQAATDPEHPAVVALREYEKALLQHEKNPASNTQTALDAAMERVTFLGAWDYEARVKEVLSRLKLVRHDQTVGSLSGGERKRVALAMILLQEPDLMVLDEPTNHLDLDMIEWLEEYLSRPSMSLLIVTHDRYFLDRVTDEIIEIERGKMFRYKGNYSYYLEKKTELTNNLRVETDKAQKLMKKELEWIRTQPKARTTKSKSRIDAFEHIENKARQQIYESEIDFDMVKTERIGGKTVEMNYISKGFGDNQLLQDFNYSFGRYDRVGIVGPNGIGKSTFLNMAIGQEKPDKGSIVIGQTVKFGYYTQEGLHLKEDKKAIDVVRDVAEFLPLEKGKFLTAAQLMYHFQFAHHKHDQYFSTLSGGEQRRLYLLTILMQNPNFLILDEPTNDLDLLTLNILEEFLIHFKGCLVIVSHDRYFMDKLVDHILVFEGKGKVRDYPGNYSQYREVRLQEIEEERDRTRQLNASLAPTDTRGRVEKEKRKLSFKEQREYDGLASEIEAAENEKNALEQQLSSGKATHEELHQWSARIAVLAALIENKTDRWLELSEFV